VRDFLKIYNSPEKTMDFLGLMCYNKKWDSEFLGGNGSFRCIDFYFEQSTFMPEARNA